MLVGYVSDENDCAIAGADIELESDDRSISIRSTASGAVYADLEPGCYQVVITCSGYGAKRTTVKVMADIPVRFRMLSDGMTGFMWPKWVQAGETSEYCVHSTHNFRLDLWRYGWEKYHIRTLGWCGEHGAGAMKQITPDGDYSQSGVNWNRVGYNLEYQKHAIVAPERSG
ncbi:MAG: carboxypeptidase-like regulatory domain-containing protein, partial [Planctomycetes bacterium]|nr:carboxypeptidase-like regulatory domain-containing protein [Planctomycetota bacterium]